MTAAITYKGNLRTEMVHLQSGTQIETDAPTDNKGKGERFSPTDLLAASLGSCIITTMAIKAENLELNFEETKIEVTKTMSTDAPRRIIAVKAVVIFPPNFAATDEQRKQLEHIAHSCPVAKSLHPDLKQEIEFVW